MKTLRLKTLVICLAATLPMMANAYEPSVTALGMGGVYTSGWMDGLMPVYQNNQQLVYSDVQFEGNSTNSGILSAGGGYRQQINPEGIAGAYLFYDRERSASEYYYNVISPGVEYLTPSWQYRLNYYAPFGTKSHLVSQGWAEDFGNTQFIQRAGHGSNDRMQYNYESLSYGADATVGYRFQTDKRWQVNLSPYVFNQTDSNTMMGANAQLNFYTNDNTTVYLGDGYDNANHNRVFVGVSFTFGGHNNDDTVDNLMQAPVYRNLDVNTTSNGLPVNDYVNFGAEEHSADNLWYVNNSNVPPGAEEGYETPGYGDGTYENPYSSTLAISESNTALPDNADIRVAYTGISYGQFILGEGYGSPGSFISLTGTQTIAGYTNDYNILATGDNRPIIFTNGVVLNGDNTLTGLQFLNQGGAASPGVTVHGNATIDDVVIGSTDPDSSYYTGIQNQNNSGDVVIKNSTINAAGIDGNVIGIDNEGNAGNMTITDSVINAIENGEVGASSLGIFNFGNSGNLAVSDSIINSQTNDPAGIAYGVTIGSGNPGMTTFSGSVITAVNSGGNGSTAYGIYNETDEHDASLVVINDYSTINVTAQIATSVSGEATVSSDTTININH